MENKGEVTGLLTRERGIDFRIFILPTTKRKKYRKKTQTKIHSTATTTNSWRRRQTRRELIFSPMRRGLQGERWRKTQNCFYPCMALRPVGPSSLSLPPLSLPTACFSLSPHLSLHQSPSAVLLRVGPNTSSTLLLPFISRRAGRG